MAGKFNSNGGANTDGLTFVGGEWLREGANKQNRRFEATVNRHENFGHANTELHTRLRRFANHPE